MSVFEVFCCVQAVVFLLKTVFKGMTHYEKVREELLLEKLLNTFPKGKRIAYQLLFFIDAIFDMICLIILCKVISRFIG